MMQYRKLGKSSLEVSRIGFGCMSLRGSVAENAHLFDRATEAGINFFDTADLYEKGMNEEMVGALLRSRRNDVILATKVGNQWREDGSGWDWNPRKEYILKAVDASLARLGTDHIDLYQLHGGTIEDPIDETIEAFERLCETGKIRYYGISSIRPAVVSKWIEMSRMVSVMLQYSLLDRRPERELLDKLRLHEIGVLARGPLAKGMLVDKSATSFLSQGVEEVERTVAVVRSHSGKVRSMGQTALQFVLDHAAVTTAVTGIRTTTQLGDAAGSFDAPWLTGEEIGAFRHISRLEAY